MVIPLFISALRRAGDRPSYGSQGYVPGAPRGSLYELAGKQDSIAFGLILCFVLLWWGPRRFFGRFLGVKRV